jgi:hypothetical protein
MGDNYSSVDAMPVQAHRCVGQMQKRRPQAASREPQKKNRLDDSDSTVEHHNNGNNSSGNQQRAELYESLHATVTTCHTLLEFVHGDAPRKMTGKQSITLVSGILLILDYLHQVFGRDNI